MSIAYSSYVQRGITNQQQHIDLEFLNGSQIRLELKLGQHNDLITSIGAGMADDDERIDVALRKQTQSNLGTLGL